MFWRVSVASAALACLEADYSKSAIAEHAWTGHNQVDCKHTFETVFHMICSSSEILIALNIFWFNVPFHCYGNH